MVSKLMSRSHNKSERKFDPEDRKTLRNSELCNLPDDAIDKLEKYIFGEEAILEKIRSFPTLKQQRTIHKNLRKATSDLITELRMIKRFTVFFPIQSRFLNQLDLMMSALDKIQIPNGKVGNKELDLQYYVYGVARIMLEHGIKPQKTGRQFREILEIVFMTVGEKPKSAKTAVSKYWDCVEELLEYPDGPPDWNDIYG